MDRYYSDTYETIGYELNNNSDADFTAVSKAVTSLINQWAKLQNTLDKHTDQTQSINIKTVLIDDLADDSKR